MIHSFSAPESLVERTLKGVVPSPAVLQEVPIELVGHGVSFSCSQSSLALSMMNDLWVKIDNHEKIVGNFCQNFHVPLIFKTLLLKSILCVHSYGETLWDIFVVLSKGDLPFLKQSEEAVSLYFLFSEMYLFFPSSCSYHLVFARDQAYLSCI